MARKDDYRGVERFCVMCKNVIPPDRKWDAVTCGPACTKTRKDFGRSRKDQLECRYCLRPSTPEERARYQAWRRWERAGQGDEKSAASLLRQVQKLTRRLAELEAVDANS